MPGAANGIAKEPGRTHLLVADVHHGGIYRHAYGVNTAVRDSRGAVWFTQSARNTPEEGGDRMWAAVDTALAEGALYRLQMRDGQPAGQAELVVDGPGLPAQERSISHLIRYNQTIDPELSICRLLDLRIRCRGEEERNRFRATGSAGTSLREAKP